MLAQSDLPLAQHYLSKGCYRLDKSTANVHCCDCLEWLNDRSTDFPGFSLTFLDPPFNQGKKYRVHDDRMTDSDYWEFMSLVSKAVFEQTIDGGSIYFMQREKNSERVLQVLRESGWTLQNFIVWKKLTSAIPSDKRYGKAFQVIAFATKGRKPYVFNKLRIAPRLPMGYRPHTNGVYVTDVWDDIRELTAGYFAGEEAMRNNEGEREHKQQSPIGLLLRIVLSSTLPGMKILDPFAGSGTTSIVSSQLARESTSIEIDPRNCQLIEKRLLANRSVDDVNRFRADYVHTHSLENIWPRQVDSAESMQSTRKEAHIR